MSSKENLQDFKRYSLQERGMKYLSYKAIESTINDLTRFYGLPCKKLNTHQIRTYLQESALQRGWSPKTYRNQRQSLSTYYQWLKLLGQLKRNPILEIQKPKLPHRLPRSLSKEQASCFLNATRWIKWQSSWLGVRNEAIVATFLYTGVRLSELLNAKVTDIDLDEDYIIIKQGKMRKDRIVPIHSQLKPILRSYITKRMRRDKTSSWLFTGAHSCYRLYPKNIHKIFKRISEEVGFKCTPHMLRHTFGRLSVEAGLGLFKIKEIMGHESVSTTQIYLSVSPQNLKESFQSVDLM